MVNHPRSWTPILTHAYFVLKVFFVVQSLSHVQLFATPRTAACQALLSSTISQSLLKFVSIEPMMPSHHLILCCPLLLQPSIFPSIRVFPMSRLLASSGQIIGTSASASVLPVNTQGWFPLGLTGLVSLLSKGHSRVFSSTQFKSINSLTCLPPWVIKLLSMGGTHVHHV